ncbi:MAG: SUMF1/EgtB/PvdO family nonheme iron enzyme [Desulfobacterales bacterium]|nr:SUMF1/EgtB/PvdO family nonheme iron enzyme [Desulfobacterales bacterium]
MTRLTLLFMAMLALAWGVPAQAGKRVALVVGNAGYKASPLKNPVNDATDVAGILRGLGFEVLLETDADLRRMLDAVRDFGRKAADAKKALFFYAGHGIQVQGVNYLVPVGADLESVDEAPFETLEAGRVLAKMEQAGTEVNIVILDACRDNPFRSFRSFSRGLAEVRAMSGSIIIYATGPGDVASDGSGRNSPFTANLMKHMATPGLRVDDVFRKTGQGVSRDTGGRQTPWISSSLYGDHYFSDGAFRTKNGASPPPKEDEMDLDQLLAMAGQKQAERHAGRTGEQGLRIRAREQGRADVRFYRKLAALPSGKALLGDAWKVLAAKYPSQTAGLKQGDIIGLAAFFAPNAGELFIEPVTGMEFAWVPGGCFQMGSPKTEEGGKTRERPMREVCVDGFWMGRHEVTNTQFRKLRPDHGSKAKDGLPTDANGQPVVMVNWADAEAYGIWLSSLGNGTYRLPTEAEWEFAARAGTKSSRHWGEDPDAACLYGNVGDQTFVAKYPDKEAHNCDDGYVVASPVGSFRPNPLGLHDMVGNAWEWCADWYYDAAYEELDDENPFMNFDWDDNMMRTARGGSWYSWPDNIRSAMRVGFKPKTTADNVGFRLVRLP